jgi:hypothetical protein
MQRSDSGPNGTTRRRRDQPYNELPWPTRALIVGLCVAVTVTAVGGSLRLVAGWWGWI